jgi:hypothetical protein
MAMASNNHNGAPEFLLGQKLLGKHGAPASVHFDQQDTMRVCDRRIGARSRADVLLYQDMQKGLGAQPPRA